MTSPSYIHTSSTLAPASSSLKQMDNRALAALFSLIFVYAASTCTLAQSSSEFLSLRKHINKQVTVDTEQGQVTGQLLRAEQNGILIYDAGKPKPIARESVKKVTKHKSRHTAAWIAGMSAAGLGAGFLIGLRAFDDATNANTKIGTAALAGAGAGAAAGFGLSRIGRQEEVIYQAYLNETAKE